MADGERAARERQRAQAGLPVVAREDAAAALPDRLAPSHVVFSGHLTVVRRPRWYRRLWRWLRAG